MVGRLVAGMFAPREAGATVPQGDDPGAGAGAPGGRRRGGRELQPRLQQGSVTAASAAPCTCRTTSMAIAPEGPLLAPAAAPATVAAAVDPVG